MMIVMRTNNSCNTNTLQYYAENEQIRLFMRYSISIGRTFFKGYEKFDCPVSQAISKGGKRKG